MKKLKLLKLIKEIKSLNKNDFHVFRVDADTDYSTMWCLSELLDSQNIKHVIVRNDLNMISMSLKDKNELLEQVKKEIGLEN